MLYLLADSACRVSEVCGLRMSDLDLSARAISVEGKGGKRRVVPIGPTTVRAMYAHLRDANRAQDDYVFQSERGGPMTRNAVLHLFKRLQKVAGLSGVRCSPHTLRHFSATEFLRGGGDPLALQRLLGHTSLAMTRRYTQVVDADVARQHRLASPVERLSGKGGR